MLPSPLHIQPHPFGLALAAVLNFNTLSDRDERVAVGTAARGTEPCYFMRVLTFQRKTAQRNFV